MISPWCWSEAVSRCLTCLLTLTSQGGLPQCMCKGQDKHVLSVVSQKATGERQSRTGLSEHPKNPDLCESGCKPFQVNVTYWCPGISFNWNQRKGDPFGVNGGGESDFSNFILISGIKAPQPLNETLLMRILLHLNYFYFLSANLCAWGWGQSREGWSEEDCSMSGWGWASECGSHLEEEWIQKNHQCTLRCSLFTLWEESWSEFCLTHWSVKWHPTIS